MRPFERVSSAGEDEPLPGRISLSWLVPVSVPSLNHNSRPEAEVAAKSTRLPRAARLPGAPDETPVRMSLTSEVPASVPSLRHSSWPVAPSFAAKRRRPA